MQLLKGLHHIAIICADYQRSKQFYTEVLGFEIVREVYRTERDSYKLDLSLNGEYIIELFSFPARPPRPSRPEAIGLRHIAFRVSDIDATVKELAARGVVTEPIRVDELTQKRFTFLDQPHFLGSDINNL